MNAPRHIRLRIFGWFAALLIGAIAALVAGLWVGAAKGSGGSHSLLLVGLVAGFLLVGLVTWVWMSIDKSFAQPLHRLSSALRAQAQSSDAAFPVASFHGLGDLAAASDTLRQALAATRTALTESVSAETSQILAERASLSNLMADLPFGVVLCSGLHHIALYNRQADVLLDTAHAPGLDHSIFDYVEAAPIQAAYDRLLDDKELHQTHLFLTALEDSRPLIAQMRLVHLPAEQDVRPAYILTLRPQRNIETIEDNDALSLRTADLLLNGLPTTSLRRRPPLPLLEPEDVRAIDLTRQIASRFPATEISADCVEVDKLETIPALVVPLACKMLDKLHREFQANTLSVLITPVDDERASLIIGWSGQSMRPRDLDRCLDEICMPDPKLSGGEILEILQTDAWTEIAPFGRHLIKLPLRRAPSERAAPASPKRLTYNLDLMVKTPAPDVSSADLTSLSYVVFDTETTGLEPDKGDEICQIAALRIVGGAVVENEKLDLLVNPGRSIPASATKIHHITNEMVKSAPDIRRAGSNFHSFARGAVLVAHNAPFDLAFLRKHQNDIGHAFDNPVIDTVLLSAILFGQDEVHTLDAICERLGITIPPELRHTAMGDTDATAQVFLKMMEMCRARGLTTFEQLRSEMRKHGRLIKDLNI